MHEYNPQWVTNYFDDYGEKEWERLVKTPTEEVKLFIHTHYLKEYIRSSGYVLEIAAGAGRFTQILVDLGAKVVVYINLPHPALAGTPLLTKERGKG